MRKLGWVMDGGGFWDVDVSTPATLNGLARPVPGEPNPSILGLSRGVRLSRPKQLDFFQRFMFMPFVPSYSNGNGFCLQRVVSLPFALDRWFATVVGEVNVEKLATNGFQSIGRHLRLDFCSELFPTPDDTLLLSLESHGRKKAVFHHKFPHHNLTLEAASPGLFVDKNATLWDVPLSMAIDLASVTRDSESGKSYHICINHNAAPPKKVEGDQLVASSLQPGLSATCAFSLKNKINIWKSGAPKLKMVQPYDLFLSTPHISASGMIGAVMTASSGSKGFASFATLSLSAQYGTFQRMFLDLTRFQARLEAVGPKATVSFQQQLVGPFSFRVDSGVELGPMFPKVKDPVFAVEYALQVLASAKAVAWYSPTHKNFMMELRFFET